MSKICGGSWQNTAAASPALNWRGECVGSRESTLARVSAMSLSSGNRSPSLKARAAASSSRTVAWAGEPPNMTIANWLASAVNRMDRPSP